MSTRRRPWHTWLGVIGAVALLLAGGLAFAADGMLCGPVSSWMRPHPVGGPNFYKSFNHRCGPFSPVDPAPAGMRPGQVPHNVIEAYFDHERRITMLTSWNSDARMFWRQTTTYHPNGRVATHAEGQIGDKWKRTEYDTRGNLLREIAIEPPAETSWKPAG